MTATRSLSASLQHLNRTLLTGESATLPDAELVRRFVERRDEVAFAVLVRRYGMLVLGVCRRLLRHEQDAEDAFQATFLVLARDASSVERAGAIGNWLYGVAANISRKAKATRHRRELKERAAGATRRIEAPPEMPDDLPELLDGELSAIPDKYRTPIVLCDLQGLTTQQAAAEVGCPPKTLGTRLSRGRAILAQRLTRRGVVLSAALIPAALATCTGAQAAVPPQLLDSSTQAAISFATGSAPVSPAVIALTQGVTNAMSHTSLKYVMIACSVIALAGLSGGSLWHHHTQAAPAPPGVPEQPANGVTAVRPEPPPARPVNPFDQFHRVLRKLFSWTEAARAESAAAPADDKKDDKPKPLTGTWAKKEGELVITFEKEAMKISPHGKDELILILCEYTRDKDGLVKAKITGFEGQEDAKKKLGEILPVGTEFRFKWKGEKENATLEGVKGEKVDPLKSHLEGEYGEKK